ncbi:MAG: nucleotidyltransferase domain-containing protein [Phycisphaerae bacterium]|nr:nucleotidyltransferase domain-containing protein [Phycisphaerae bacterium]NUQ46564.1 nucleotidyltransferase domain-containing protein [Phycisphaerae bacterium]
MATHDSDAEIILRDLRERAKELNCLYTVEELTSEPDLSLERIVEGIIAAIPPAWQYPEVCQARIDLNGTTYGTPDYQPTPWAQKADIHVQGENVGVVEVSYTREMPHADEGPFLAGERKLVESIADRLGNCLTHRRLLEAMNKWRRAERELARSAAPEWKVILDLLRRTDQSLLLRVARKMINYLRWSGATEADALFRHFAGPADADADPRLDRNQPLDRREPPHPKELVAQAFRIAESRLSDAEIVACIHQWIKHDRAAFLVDSLEHERTSLTDIADAIVRYLRATRGEVELLAPTLKGLRVSLIRRVLTDQLEYINIAKTHLEISDFQELLGRTIFPPDSHGRLGGKAAGLLLARRIIEKHAAGGGPLADVRTPRTWYITSDALHEFIHENHLEDVFAQKYKDIEEIRQEYPDIIQLFKNSHFPPDIVKGVSLAMDELGDKPLIVRSSSLLEDRSGAAFSGKYKSLFVANQGDKRDRLATLLDAIAEVYASILAPDPIEYRAERNLLDFQEGMGILIQEVVGCRVGDYYLPLVAGVGFSHNEFRWSPRIRREDGLLRLVPGLGTRAVDRTGDDFPVLVSPGQPGLRANASPDEVARYSPRYLDVINIRANRFETVSLREFLRHVGDGWEGVGQMISLLDGGRFRTPMLGQVDLENDEPVVTFDGLMSRTPLVKQLGEMLTVLRNELKTPIDIEFAHDGRNLYLLQCRAQSAGRSAAPAPIPRDIPHERVVFSARRFVSNGAIPGLTHLVYVDPERYAAARRLDDLLAVGRAVNRLNKVLPKRRFALMGPGRWGSLGDIKLGVRVTYSDINNTALLVEIARRTGQYTPDLSFGTHFFQDLVEAGIRYLPLYPDDPDVVFNELFLTRSDNMLPHLAPEFAGLADLVRVIDVTSAADNQVLRVLMNGDLEEAVAFLTPPDATIESPEATETMIEPPRHQFWRWRLRMAERMAEQLDGETFGVAGLYVFGSTETGAAGPGSDIDLLVHFRGTPEQRAALERWLEGWSLCLAEMNFLRTGYRSNGLLDVHFVSDEDIAQKSSFAVKIGAVTDPARPLRTWPA